jgi:hypothetical protein
LAKISFQYPGKKRTQLFLKYPASAPRPEGEWECFCGKTNIFGKEDQQYCVGCGTKLKIQQNLDPRQRLTTLVRVGHIEPNGASNGQPLPVSP